MAAPATKSDRTEKDPYISYNFEVKIAGVGVANFASVSGLSVEVAVFDFQEGGVNDHTHRLPGQTKWDNIVLRRGVTDSHALYEWAEKAARGTIERKQVDIYMRDTQNKAIKTWEVSDAWPAKWEAPGLDSGKNEVGIETLELAHNGFKMT
jgi:phage tail-like protein